MNTILGIDFGTNYYRTAVFREGIVDTFYERKQLPKIIVPLESSLFELPSGFPKFVYRGLKQYIDSTERLSLANNSTHSFPDLVRSIFREILLYIEKTIGAKIDGVILAVPGIFTDKSRSILRDALHEAGFESVRLVNEDIAIIYGQNALMGKGKALVYGFGAGFFCVSILDINGGKLRTLAIEGNRYFGGNDLDMALAAIMFEHLGKTEVLPSEGSKFLLEEAERFKLELSRQEETCVTLDIERIHLVGRNISFQLKRHDFEAAVAKSILATFDKVNLMLSEVRLSPSDIDVVVLAGGSSELPLIKKTIEKHFIAPVITANEDAIARGAALMGAQMEVNDWKRRLPKNNAQDTVNMPSSQPKLTAKVQSSGKWLNMYANTLMEAEALWNSGNQGAAIHTFEEMLSNQKEYLVTLYQSHGQGLLRNQQYDEAIDALKKARDISPSDKQINLDLHQSYNRKANILVSKRDWKQAEIIIKESLKILPNCSHCQSLYEQIKAHSHSKRTQNR